MPKAFFDKDFMKNSSKIVFCPSCSNKFLVGLDEKEIFCDECEMDFLIEFEQEEFIWHPSEKY